MSRTNKFDSKLFRSLLGGGTRFFQNIQTLTGTLTMQNDAPPLQFLDPGGAARDVLLPPEVEGLFIFIVNTADAAETITVKDDSGVATIGTVAQNTSGMFVCDGTVWRKAVL